MKPRLVQTRYGLDIDYVENSYSVANIAGLKAIVANDMEAGATAWVTSLKTSFFFDPTNTDAPDDVEVVKPTYGSAVAGRWVKEHGIASGLTSDAVIRPDLGAGLLAQSETGSMKVGHVLVWPTVGGGDDSLKIASAILAEANGQGREIWLQKGSIYRCSSPIPWRTGTSLFLRGATIIASLTPSGGPQTACLFETRSLTAWEGAGGVTAATTLSTNAVLGSNQVSVVSVTTPNITVGSIIEIVTDYTAETGWNRGYCYKVLGISGTGPFVLTLDRRLCFAFQSASSAVWKLTYQPTKLKMIGDGARISGTCDRYFETIAARNSEVEGVIFDADDGAPSEMVGSFDIGGFRNKWVDCDADMGGTNITGFNHEGGELAETTRCTARECGSSGISMTNTAGGVIENCTTHGGGNAIVVTGTNSGSLDCHVRDCTAYRPTAAGVYLIAQRTVVSGLRAIGAANGVVAKPGSSGTQVVGYTSKGSRGSDFYAESDMWINGAYCDGTAGMVGVPGGGCAAGQGVSVTDFFASATGDSVIVNALRGTAASVHRFSKGTISLTGSGSYAFYSYTVGGIEFYGVNGIGSGSNRVGVGGVPGSNVWLNRFDFSSYATPQEAGPTYKTATYV